MQIKKRFSRVMATLLVLIMTFTSVPIQGFAAEAADPAKVELKDGTVAISSDMSESQVKKALFDALAVNPEGKDYNDYSWEYYCSGFDSAWGWYQDAWGSVNGFTSEKKVALTWHYYNHSAIKDNSDASYKIRLAGGTQEVTVTKKSSCDVTYNYDALMGKVLVNDSQVSGTVNGVSPSKELQFKVVPNPGYKIVSVKMNGNEVEEKDGVYTVVPVAATTIDVEFSQDGTFYTLTIPEIEGVTVKLNGNEVTGEVSVSGEKVSSLEYIPDENTSVKSVVLNDKDVTSEVTFENYIGKQDITFEKDSVLNIVPVNKDAQVVLTDAKEAAIAINEDGSWNYDEIRSNIIAAIVDTEKSVSVPFSAENIEVNYWNHGRTNGQYVNLEWSEGWGETFDGQLTFPNAVKAGTVDFRFKFAGNNQFRPSDYQYAKLDMKDVEQSSIATKENPQVTLKEVAVGKIDYSNFKQDIFNAAIDAEASNPVLKFEDVEISVQENITESGKYSVTVKYPGNKLYYASQVTFDVNVTVEKLPEANIALKSDSVETVLKETKVGVYDYESMKTAIFEAAVDSEKCVENGLDVSKLSLEIENMTVSGDYTATITYAGDDMHYPSSASVKVKVEVQKLPTVQISKEKDSATLYEGYPSGNYKYDDLKQEIFNEVIKVTGVEGLNWNDFTYQYEIVDGLGTSRGYYDFDYRNPWWDTAELGHWLYKGGNFNFKVSIPNSENYYGAEITLNLNIAVEKTDVSEIVVKEGAPFNVTLNRNYNRSYDYEGLKKAIFEAAVAEVKNVPNNFNFDYTTFNYECAILDPAKEDFKDFEDGELVNGGKFVIKISLPDGNGYYGSFAKVEVNVDVVDIYATSIALNENINGVTLNETTVGNYDFESLKNDIFNSAIDTAKSVPSNLTVENIKFTIPEIKESGDYKVTAEFIANKDYVTSSVEFTIHVDVNNLPTAELNVKSNKVEATLRETSVGIYDYDQLKKDIFEAAIDGQNSNPAVAFEDVQILGVDNVTSTSTVDVTIKYPGTDKIHGTSVVIAVKVNVDSRPQISIDVVENNKSMVLNKTKDGGYNYDQLKQQVFNNIRVSGYEGLEWKNFVYQYDITDNMLIHYTRDFETRGSALADPEETLFHYLHEEGNFKIFVSIPDSSNYYGTSVEFNINVKVEDPFKPSIVLKENFNKDFTLYYKADGSYDYDRLRKEIFENVVDVEKSVPSGITWEDVKYTYDSFGGPIESFINFEDEPADIEDTFRIYLYKPYAGSNEKTIKIDLPETENYNSAYVKFNVNVVTYSRNESNVVLAKDGEMSYTNDVNAIKQYIFDNLIDKSSSKLPADVSVDDFVYEYYALYYTSGGALPGIDRYWAPIEGKQDVLDVIYKQIGSGTNKIRVYYKGNDKYTSAYSNEVNITLNKADFSISLKQNYKYLDESLPNDFVKPSVNDNFEHYYVFMDSSSSTGTIYLDSLSGLGVLDFTGNIPFSTMLTQVLGTGITADSVYNRDGLTREQLVTLLTSESFIAYCNSNYSIDANAFNDMLNVLNSLPAEVTKFMFSMGQPTKPGTYTAFAMATNPEYNTATAASEFYVKYHKKGTKLVFVQNAGNLNSFNAKNFDFSATITKDGVPIKTDNIRYIYTGITYKGRIYASTTKPPTEAGIYTQTAWTFLGTYAFPITRTFQITLL